MLLLLPALLAGRVADSFTPIAWDNSTHLDLEYRGQKRLYHIILPSGYAAHPDRSFPAIMMLHGNGDNASVMAATTTLTHAGPQAGYAMIFPEGVQTPNSDRPTQERSWNAGTCCGMALIDAVDDMHFLKLAIEHATKHFRIDQEKVFLSGHSNGGSLTLRAVCELGKEYFAGAAANVGSLEPVRGEYCASNCKPSDDGYYYCAWDQQKPKCRLDDWEDSLPSVFTCNQRGGALPIMLFNGNLDPFSSPLLPGTPNNSGLVNYPTKAHSEDPTYYNVSFPPLSYVMTKFAKMNGCSMSVPPSVSFRNGTTGNTTVCHTWTGCAANVTSCLSDGGHTWYGDFYTADYLHELCEYETGGPPMDAYWQCSPQANESVWFGCQGGDTCTFANTYSVDETSQTLAFFEREAGVLERERGVATR
jgi:poly(3-hydroxybutyrate) depolymerase